MITVVSGIPRSGTSLMMQMMAAGGMPVLTDGQRSADANNPRGYFELESVKALGKNQDVAGQAEGKVVKVISSLLPSLPKQFQYRVIFMCRPLEEVVSSQNRMLERLGKDVPATPTTAVIAAFQEHLKKTKSWLSQQPNFAVLYVDYPAVLQAPEENARKICSFLGRDLDVSAMISQIEQSLHREKSASAGTLAGTPPGQR
ncbi:MAG: sulfotransferase domain-containing protein [Chlamydiota bacterium]